MKSHSFNTSSITFNKNVVDEFYNYFVLHFFHTCYFISAIEVCWNNPATSLNTITESNEIKTFYFN
jgi:hypothetical protein